MSKRIFQTHIQPILKPIPPLLSPHTLLKASYLHGYISLIITIYDAILHPVFTTILTHPDYATLRESRLDTAQTTFSILPPPFTSVYV